MTEKSKEPYKPPPGVELGTNAPYDDAQKHRHFQRIRLGQIKNAVHQSQGHETECVCGDCIFLWSVAEKAL